MTSDEIEKRMFEPFKDGSPLNWFESNMLRACAETAKDIIDEKDAEFEISKTLLKELMKFGTGGNWPTGSADAWDAAFARAEDFIASLK